jgi:hypothetical protein
MFTKLFFGQNCVRPIFHPFFLRRHVFPSVGFVFTMAVLSGMSSKLPFVNSCWYAGAKSNHNYFLGMVEL